MAFHCMGVPHLAYPLIHQWTLELFTPLGSCEQRSWEHGCASTCLRPCFQIFETYSQKQCLEI